MNGKEHLKLTFDKGALNDLEVSIPKVSNPPTRPFWLQKVFVALIHSFRDLVIRKLQSSAPCTRKAAAWSLGNGTKALNRVTFCYFWDKCETLLSLDSNGKGKALHKGWIVPDYFNLLKNVFVQISV